MTDNLKVKASKVIDDAGTAEVIRISLLPVRPDMFDAAGLARALRGHLGIETGLPVYRLEPSGLRVSVKPGCLPRNPCTGWNNVSQGNACTPA